MNISKVLDYLDRDYNTEAQFHQGICEPRYEDKAVITANWNNISRKLADVIEQADYAIEWCDEWIECDTCYKIFRCVENSYSWQMFGHVFDGYALCGNCLAADPVEFLESMENNPHMALTVTLADVINVEEWGYELVQEGFENGFHPGQNANPTKILAMVQNQNPGIYIFVMTGQGQFDIEFALYRKN